MEQTHIKSFGLRLVLARHVITPQGLLFNGENLATLTMLQQMFIFQEASAIQVTKST